MSDRELLVRQRLKDDLEHYAQKCLSIRTKTDGVVSLTFNPPQKFLHSRLEQQLAKTGKIRAIILKGRQQGCSTYVGARFYHRVTHSKGLRVFILTHEQEATDNLFGMASRYHEHCPALVKPHTGSSNAKELSFDKLDSGYRVGTAGTKAVGRSQTVQLFHGSEVAFWPNAETHAGGVLQAVPNAPGTEVILESTANGLGNYFHQIWQDAEAGQSEYDAIFIPWFWTPEYTKPVAADYELTPEEAEYQGQYGLTLGQMAWRRAKMAELKSDWLFKQEYPATAAEAFQMSGQNSYIAAELVIRARKNDAAESGPLVIGVDPARFGEDRTSISRRRGRKAYPIESYSKKDTMEVAGMCAQIIRKEDPAAMFIDVGGLGAGVVDRLNELGFGYVIHAVNGGEKPNDDAKYGNKRAEMWGRVREWLESPNAPDLPDSDALHADLIGPTYRYNSSTQLLLERKEDMKKRGLRSPDEGDALALTFAEIVVSDEIERPQRYSGKKRGSGSWMAA